MGTAITIIAFLLLFPSLVSAACHLYITPQIGDGGFGGSWRPKYIYTLGVTWSGIRYGSEGYYLVAADTSAEQDTTLSAETDVIRLPDNLDGTIGGQLSNVQNKLEAANLPAGWVTSGMTYRSVLRTVIHMMRFVQRFSGINKVYTAFLSGSVTLNTQFGSLSAANQKRLLDAANSMNLDTSGLSGSTTIRQILKNIADQFQDRQITLGCATI